MKQIWIEKSKTTKEYKIHSFKKTHNAVYESLSMEIY